VAGVHERVHQFEESQQDDGGGQDEEGRHAQQVAHRDDRDQGERGDHGFLE
jgi:hypothetical protein